MPDDPAPADRTSCTPAQALGLPALCVDGVEADDVIGTLGRQKRGGGCPKWLIFHRREGTWLSWLE